MLFWSYEERSALTLYPSPNGRGAGRITNKKNKQIVRGSPHTTLSCGRGIKGEGFLLPYFHSNPFRVTCKFRSIHTLNRSNTI